MKNANMKPGDLVRLVRHAPSHYGFRNSVGLVVSQRWNSRGTACVLQVAFGKQVMDVHPGWLEVVNESR